MPLNISHHVRVAYSMEIIAKLPTHVLGLT